MFFKYNLGTGVTTIGASSIFPTAIVGASNPRITSNGVNTIYICCGLNTRRIYGWNIFTSQFTTYS